MNNLKELTEAILFRGDDRIALKESIYAMHDLYATHTGIHAHAITDDSVMLPSGNAISPIQAAHCLLDMQRTGAFLRGIYKAILRLQQDFPGQKVNILYAGCGPYATLLTPFTALFTPDELSFSLLDINPVSIDSVTKLYSALGLNDYIREVILADAVTYQLPAHITTHMVVSETMQRALIKEPQVAIMLNLIPQMRDHTIFIPEEISVSMKLLNWIEEQNRMFVGGGKAARVDLGMLYTIGRYNCEEHTPHTIQMPSQNDKFRYLNLFTEIGVFAGEHLAAHSCGLCLPLEIADVKGREDSKMRLRYEMGGYPGFKYEWL